MQGSFRKEPCRVCRGVWPEGGLFSSGEWAGGGAKGTTGWVAGLRKGMRQEAGRP